MRKTAKKKESPKSVWADTVEQLLQSSGTYLDDCITGEALARRLIADMRAGSHRYYLGWVMQAAIEAGSKSNRGRLVGFCGAIADHVLDSVQVFAPRGGANA
jgi:hypothetical protein